MKHTTFYSLKSQLDTLDTDLVNEFRRIKMRYGSHRKKKTSLKTPSLNSSTLALVFPTRVKHFAWLPKNKSDNFYGPSDLFHQIFSFFFVWEEHNFIY